MSDSVRPHRWQPTRLPRPWDSSGKNTGVGFHFLLQCMKVKSESEVAQSCPTLSNPMDCSLPGSSVHGIFQARVLEWGATHDLYTHTISNLRAGKASVWISKMFIGLHLISDNCHDTRPCSSVSSPDLTLAIQSCFMSIKLYDASSSE